MFCLRVVVLRILDILREGNFVHRLRNTLVSKLVKGEDVFFFQRKNCDLVTRFIYISKKNSCRQRKWFDFLLP